MAGKPKKRVRYVTLGVFRRGRRYTYETYYDIGGPAGLFCEGYPLTRIDPRARPGQRWRVTLERVGPEEIDR